MAKAFQDDAFQQDTFQVLELRSGFYNIIVPWTEDPDSGLGFFNNDTGTAGSTSGFFNPHPGRSPGDP